VGVPHGWRGLECAKVFEDRKRLVGGVKDSRAPLGCAERRFLFTVKYFCGFLATCLPVGVIAHIASDTALPVFLTSSILPQVL
jgi:hypothetical protein